MIHSEKIDMLSKALTQAQAEFPAIGLDATNPFFNSKYATLGAVIEATKPILSKYGLAVTQLTVGEGGQAGIETILIHESGQYISSTIILPIVGNKAAQEAGAIISYTRRYSWSAILGLYSDEDDDGNSQLKMVNAVKKIAPEVKITKLPDMTFEEAMAEKSSDGKSYGEIAQEDLDKKLFGIRKKLGMPDLPAEERVTYEQKENAILALKYYRGQKK